MTPRMGLEVSISLVAMVLAIHSAAAEEKRLTGGEIRNLYTGARVYWPGQAYGYSLGQRIYQVDFKPGGALEGLMGVDQYVGSKETGTWWIAGDTLCIKWTKWFKGRQGCVGVTFDGEKSGWYRPDGQRVREVKLVR